MKNYPELQNIKIQGLFLDNTFCDPFYVFPVQKIAIQEIIDIIRKEVIHIYFSRVHKPKKLG